MTQTDQRGPACKRRAITRDFRSGVRIWRIAQDRRMTINDVLEVLVDSGEITLGYSQLLGKMQQKAR